ncbi:uncharacterized protein LOC143025410 isoform X2 [Oratosquilla oratoria]|uniref:uncharacterized protein LOC143025410 isoform X2 n=1 Tax=Oratosquilla oratoria TaxID=337810 RepID=UPI003F76AB8D
MNFNLYRLTEVDLSNLAYGGQVSLEVLDLIEKTLTTLIPNMTQLIHLDLSTNHNSSTLPSCSVMVMEHLGRSCPNLKVLGVMNNNRVTSEGLLHLYSSDTQAGCMNLEKIFLHGCSIEPEDIAMLLHFFPKLKLVGYRELGASLGMLKAQPKKFSRRKLQHPYVFRLTHLDNTLSRVYRCDGEILDFVSETCPDLQNLKVRVCDEDVGEMHKLPNLQHLELRFFTGVHHPIAATTTNFLKQQGYQLTSLTIFCNKLFSRHVMIIAKHCTNLTKLYLHSNSVVLDEQLPPASNCLDKLQVLSLRVGHDELTFAPEAGHYIRFLVQRCTKLEEVFLIMRTEALCHDFLVEIMRHNPLHHLKVFVCDVPRRTLCAPMIYLTIRTVHYLIQECSSLWFLGNLISWQTTAQEVASVREEINDNNYAVTIIYNECTKLRRKYF